MATLSRVSYRGGMSAIQDRAPDRLAELVAARCGHVHLVGICGIGMAGLAFHLRGMGFNVSGCDASPNHLADWLRAADIEVWCSHDAAHIDSAVTWVVRSAAVSLDSAELRAACARRIPVFRRGEVLPHLLTRSFSVAVSGTHGKTTTSSFVTQMLRTTGRDPSWCIGGEVPALGGVAGRGAGEVLVVESDESDGTVALYRPDIAVVTNIEFDHMEHFESVAAFEACFRRFILQAGRRVIYGGDDPRAVALCAHLDSAVSFGFHADCDLRARDVSETASSTSFSVTDQDGTETRLRIPVGGRHNVLNALAATAVCREIGMPFDQITAALAEVQLPRRRFEVVAQQRGVTVISDYAHHPSEVAALVRTARLAMPRRLLAVFQPHRFTRTLALGPDFPSAFEGVDHLVLTPVYAASESPLAGGSTWDLYAHFRRAGSFSVDAEAEPERPHTVLVAGSLGEAWRHIKGQLTEGDLLLVVGAGDVEDVARWAADHVATGGTTRLAGVGDVGAGEVPDGLDASDVRANESLAGKTTLGVGGEAEVWVAAGTESDLVRALSWAERRALPVRFLGGGSNVLVSDLGVPGMVLRLAGPAFREIREADGVVVAGAGVSMARFQAWLERHGWAGLEFLEGIPGELGGALRMNAGAWGHSILERVLWIRCLNLLGKACTVLPSDLKAGYRSCAGLDGKVAIEAAFRLERGAVVEIRERRMATARKRDWMRGLRSAGSVFKNPPGASAGALIESAGLKGLSVGGAEVSVQHANVIVTEHGACASDVRALLEIVRGEVARTAGVRLEPELVLWNDA